VKKPVGFLCSMAPFEPKTIDVPTAYMAAKAYLREKNHTGGFVVVRDHATGRESRFRAMPPIPRRKSK